MDKYKYIEWRKDPMSHQSTRRKETQWWRCNRNTRRYWLLHESPAWTQNSEYSIQRGTPRWNHWSRKNATTSGSPVKSSIINSLFLKSLTKNSLIYRKQQNKEKKSHKSLCLITFESGREQKLIFLKYSKIFKK